MKPKLSSPPNGCETTACGRAAAPGNAPDEPNWVRGAAKLIRGTTKGIFTKVISCRWGCRLTVRCTGGGKRTAEIVKLSSSLHGTLAEWVAGERPIVKRCGRAKRCALRRWGSRGGCCWRHRGSSCGSSNRRHGSKCVIDVGRGCRS